MNWKVTSDKEININCFGSTFYIILAAFLALQLMGYIHISWWWFTLGLVPVALILLWFLIAIIVSIIDR